MKVAEKTNTNTNTNKALFLNKVSRKAVHKRTTDGKTPVFVRVLADKITNLVDRDDIVVDTNESGVQTVGVTAFLSKVDFFDAKSIDGKILTDRVNIKLCSEIAGNSTTVQVAVPITELDSNGYNKKVAVTMTATELADAYKATMKSLYEASVKVASDGSEE